MTRRNHAFSIEEPPTAPACRRGRRALGSVDDEAPTTLRPSSIVRARSAPRSSARPTPPPLPLPRQSPRRTPPPLPPRPSALPRPRIRSLASILEPEEEPCTITPARFVVLPPDPSAFSASPLAKPPMLSRESVRWLLRIVLMLVVLGEELVLAAPPGTLHRPRDVSDAGTMLVTAMQSSALAALGR